MIELRNIKRKAIVIDDGIYCETEFIHGCEYAYYIYGTNNEVIVKQFYSKNNFFKFDIKGNYKKISKVVKFFYKINGQIYSYNKLIDKGINNLSAKDIEEFQSSPLFLKFYNSLELMYKSVYLFQLLCKDQFKSDNLFSELEVLSAKIYFDEWIKLLKLNCLDIKKSFFSSEYNLVEPFKKVFISGFGRSGTGAVRAFLSESDKVFELPGSEIQILNGSNGLTTLLECSTLESLKLTFNKLVLVNGLGILAGFEKLDIKEFSRAHIHISRIKEKDLLIMFNLLYKDLFEEDFSRDQIIKACKNFVNRFLLAYKKELNLDEGTIYLFNNPINAFNVKDLIIIDNFIDIAVKRDPRSQYISARTTSLPNYKLISFINDYKNRMKEYKDQIAMFNYSGDFILLNFEDFIVDVNLQMKIMNILNLVINKDTFRTKFKPQESINNAMLYILPEYKHEFIKELGIIEKELEEYCLNINIDNLELEK